MSRDRIKVFYVINSLGIGGAEQLLVTLARYLEREQFDLVVCALWADGPIGQELREIGVPVHCLCKAPSLYSPVTLYELIRLMRRERPDVVHAQLFAANFYGRLAGMMSGVPVLISTEQSVVQGKKGLHIWADRVLARRTDAIITVSQVVRQVIATELRYPAAPLEVIYNPVDLNRLRAARPAQTVRVELGIGPDDIIIGSVGRLMAAKGHCYLVEALALLRPQYPALKLLLVGDGSLRAELEKQVHDLALEEVVRFLGARRDVPDLLAALDIFAFPSLWEGLGIALIEAMAMGLPCVATDIPTLREVVGDRQAALLIPPRDSRALAQAIERLVGERELARRLGAEARKRAVDEFSAETCAQRTGGLYRRLLEEKLSAGAR
jgi:glycosyltransferase involved in cell wall biosynthesis